MAGLFWVKMGGGPSLNPTNCREFLGELRNCYQKGLCSILCPLLGELDILCARYFEIRFYSFTQIVQSRVIRDSVYENCLLIYHTRILVVRTSEMCVYWKQYFWIYGRPKTFVGPVQKRSFRALPTRSSELTVHIELG